MEELGSVGSVLFVLFSVLCLFCFLLSCSVDDNEEKKIREGPAKSTLFLDLPNLLACCWFRCG